MCLPSSLLKAGSQLHSSRDSKEAKGTSLVPQQGRAVLASSLAGSVPAGADTGRRAEGVWWGFFLLPNFPCKLRPEESLTVEGRSKRAMTEELAAARSTPAELMNGCRDHQPGPTKGMVNLSCCWAAWHWLSKTVSKNTLRKWVQPWEVSLRKDSFDGGGGRAQPFLSCKCSLQALVSFAGTTTCINKYWAQHPTLISFHHAQLLTPEQPEGKMLLLLLCHGGECHDTHAAGSGSCISWGLKA